MANMDIALQAHGFNPISALEEVNQLQGKKLALDYAKQTLPDRIRESKAQADDAQARADVSTAQSPLIQEATQRQRLANALALAQTPEDWDAAVQGAVDGGYAAAKQYLGTYNKDRQHSLVGALSAGDAPSALAAASGQDPAAMAGLPGQPGAAEWQQRLASMTPAQLKDTRTKVTGMRQAITAIEGSQDPAAEWRKQAVALGYPQLANDPDWQKKLTALKASVIPAYNAIGAMDLQTNIGLPQAPQVKVERVGNALVTVDSTNPGNPTFKVGYQGQYKNSAFTDREQAYLAVHPGDTQGALEYASGRKTGAASGMTPAQIEKYAESESARQYNQGRMNGDIVDADPEWQANRKREIISSLSAAASQGAPAAPGTAGNGGAPEGPVNKYGYTPAAWTTIMQFKGSKDPAGSVTNPYTPKNQDEFERLKAQNKGKLIFYVGPSGRRLQLKVPA